MVDKQTARVLVFGTLATLAVILIVAVYAISTKGSLQADLDAKLRLLNEKQALFEKRRQEELVAMKQRETAQKKLEEERKNMEDVQIRAAAAQRETMDLTNEKKRLEQEAKEMRSRHDPEAKERERLEHLSDEELEREMEEEAELFRKEEKDLGEEHLEASDEEDLKKELKYAKDFVDQYDVAAKKIKNKEADAGKAFEKMQEYGEQNEVLLEDLERDAKRNSGGKWKEGTRPRRMLDLAHRMDMHAEALRNHEHERKLEASHAVLDNIKHNAEAAAKAATDPDDAAWQRQVAQTAESIENQEERLRHELEQGDAHEAYQAAEMLDRFSEDIQLRLKQLEELATLEKHMTPEEKKEHMKVMTVLEDELAGLEREAKSLEESLERRGLRQDAVDLSKAINGAESIAQIKNFKHGKKASEDVAKMLRTEAMLLQNMHSGNTAGQESLGRELGEEAEELEDDARHLEEEVEAGHFDNLDDKLAAERYVHGLEQAADEMKHDAQNIEHYNFQNEIRGAANNIQQESHVLSQKNKVFDRLKPKVDAVEDDAKQLDRAIGEENWDDENAAAVKSIEDAEALDHGAQELEKELGERSDLSKDERDEYVRAIEEMRSQARMFEKYAQGVKQDVRLKAEHKVEKIAKELNAAQNSHVRAQLRNPQQQQQQPVL